MTFLFLDHGSPVPTSSLLRLRHRGCTFYPLFYEVFPLKGVLNADLQLGFPLFPFAVSLRAASP